MWQLPVARKTTIGFLAVIAGASAVLVIALTPSQVNASCWWDYDLMGNRVYVCNATPTPKPPTARPTPKRPTATPVSARPTATAIKTQSQIRPSPPPPTQRPSVSVRPTATRKATPKPPTATRTPTPRPPTATPTPRPTNCFWDWDEHGIRVWVCNPTNTPKKPTPTPTNTPTPTPTPVPKPQITAKVVTSTPTPVLVPIIIPNPRGRGFSTHWVTATPTPTPTKHPSYGIWQNPLSRFDTPTSTPTITPTPKCGTLDAVCHCDRGQLSEDACHCIYNPEDALCKVLTSGISLPKQNPTNTPTPTPVPPTPTPTPVPPTPTHTPAPSVTVSQYDANDDGVFTLAEYEQVLDDYRAGKITYAQMIDLYWELEP